MSLTMILSCGKKINDPSAAKLETETSSQTPDTQTKLILRLDESRSRITSYSVLQDDWLLMPVKLSVLSGNPSGKRVRIYYNFLNNNQYEFYCNYKFAETQGEMSFENCLNDQSVVIVSDPENLSKLYFPIEKSSSIKMELSSPSGTGLVIEARY
jgi:hypothetical protein